MLSPENRGKGAAGRGVLPRFLERAKEHEMKDFQITREDLAQMEQIARVSSRADGADRWTELAVYYRAGANRPFVPVVEGHSSRPGEKIRFQHAAMGTLDRAMNWFEGSKLRDELAAAVPDAHEVIYPTGGRAPKMWRTTAYPEPYSQDEERLIEDSVASHPLNGRTRGYSGPERLTDVLAWLYPSDQARSSREQALDFERDFGVPERTTRNTLAIEAGRTEGKVGPWLKPFVSALRFFDRAAWEATRG
jgi:hypothetical protein